MKLEWDKVGERTFETGVNKGVLYPSDGAGGYAEGVVWNGLIGVSENPSGAEQTPLYADNIKYLSLTSAEEFGATIEAYTYPDEFGKCDGSAEIAAGIQIGQQKHEMFGLAYTTAIGDDIEGDTAGYKIHIIYGAQAKPSARAYKTINDSPEAITFSWEVTTTPVNVTGFKPTASLIIDSTKVAEADMAALEKALYGGSEVGETPMLLTPDEIVALITPAG
jgi:hypothetical protein